MKILLDTVTFLWFILDSSKLSDAVRLGVRDPGNEVWLSSVSAWEIAIKNRLGRLPLPEAPGRFVPAQRESHSIDTLALDEESTFHLTKLPDVHRDPFDRMLVCQAIARGLIIATPDRIFAEYPVRTMW